MFTADVLTATPNEQAAEIYEMWQMRYNTTQIKVLKKLCYDIQQQWKGLTINAIVLVVNETIIAVHEKQRGGFINMTEVIKRAKEHYRKAFR